MRLKQVSGASDNPEAFCASFLALSPGPEAGTGAADGANTASAKLTGKSLNMELWRERTKYTMNGGASLSFTVTRAYNTSDKFLEPLLANFKFGPGHASITDFVREGEKIFDVQGVLDAAERYATILSRVDFSAFGHGVSTLRACVVALMDAETSAKSLEVVKRIFDHFLAAAPFDDGAQSSFVTGKAYPI